MDHKPTSIETYHRIKDEGLLSKLRFFVYNIIYMHGPITISQMIRLAAKDVTNTGSFTGRMSELERMGLIGQHHIGPCPVTGREVIFWVTTDCLPQDYQKPESKSDVIRRLEKEIELLKEENSNIQHKYMTIIDGLISSYKEDRNMSLEDFIKTLRKFKI